MQNQKTITITSTSRRRSHTFPANPRPRPRPYLSCASTTALASKSCWTTPTWPLKAAKCNGVEPRESHGPKPSHTQNPTERRGEKSNFLEIVATQTPLNLRNIVVLRCLERVQLAETHVAFGILWFPLKPRQPCYQSK